MIDDAILAQAAALVERCRAAGLMVATAESLTSGLIAALITNLPQINDCASSTICKLNRTSYSDAPYRLAQ